MNMFSRIPKVRSLSILAASAFCSIAFAPGLHASAINRKTLVKVNAPVTIPGYVLQRGTYSFQIMKDSGGQIVAVRNADTDHFIEYVAAIPISRAVTASRPIVTLAERPSNTPPAISRWFYPGFKSGLKFNYPKYTQQSAELKGPDARTANG